MYFPLIGETETVDWTEPEAWSALEHQTVDGGWSRGCDVRRVKVADQPSVARASEYKSPAARNRRVRVVDLEGDDAKGR